MSLTVKELSTSRNFTTAATGATLTVDVLVFDAHPGGTFPTELQVYRAAYAYAPLVYLGMGKLEVDGTCLGGGVWQASVKYGVPEGRDNPGGGEGAPPPPPGVPPPPPPPPPAPAEDEPLVEVSVEVGAQQQHVTNSRRTVSRTSGTASPAPDYKGALNVTPEGVQGLDLEVGLTTFNITRLFPFVTLKYLRQLDDMVGCVNSAAWWSFPAGELKFLGATFAPHKQGDGPGGVQGVFKVARSKNRTDIVITPPDVNPSSGLAVPLTGLTVPAKKGWEYLWVAYHQAMSEGRMVSTPTAAYVEEVSEPRPFSKLGIG